MNHLRQRLRQLPGSMLAALLICVSARVDAAAPATNRVTRTIAELTAPYMRLTNTGPDSVQLLVAVRELVPTNGTGPVVWLSAVSHIGETNYYHALQRHLDAQKLVLFEGIRPGTNAVEPPPAAAEPAPVKKAAPARKGAGEKTSLQATLAESLGLAFQLHAIEYQRPHFRNSDLNVTEIQKLLEDDPADAVVAPGEKKKNDQFENLLKAMEGSSVFGMLLQGGMRLVATSPRLQAVTKLALIEVLGRLRGDISQMRNVPDDMAALLRALIHERNGAVLKDLRAELAKPNPSPTISLFYGAGHMDDLEWRIRRELGYAVRGEQWFPAIVVDFKKSGISKLEAELIRSLVSKQMEQLLPEEKKPNP